MKILVVDDEPIARRILRRLLEEQEAVDEVVECATGEEALDLLAAGDIKIAFLDIQMPGMGGIDALRQLGEEAMPVTIFVTAHEEYALRAIEAGATDYLLKPFDASRFRQAFERAQRRLRQETLLERSREIVALLGTDVEPTGHSSMKKLALQDGGELHLVAPDEIHWIEAADKHVVVHLDRGTLRSRKTLSEVECELDGRQFVRVHRSNIVALHRVATLGATSGGAPYLEMESGDRVAVSRARLAALKARLG